MASLRVSLSNLTREWLLLCILALVAGVQLLPLFIKREAYDLRKIECCKASVYGSAILVGSGYYCAP